MKNGFIALLLLITTGLTAQNFSIRGLLTDTDNAALPGAHIELLQPWGDHVASVVTETDGRFIFRNVPKGGYKIKATFLGFEEFTREVTISNADINIGTVKLTSGTQILKEVEIKDRLPMAGQKSDTVLFNADAFKVMKDASASELVEKIPTVTVESGQVKAQGENVRQVLVDGRPFFGNDPNAALRNLPAEVVERIQIFDQQSDQAQFTGFNDGNTSRTINLITRPGMRVGQFGKLYAGYGTDNKYQTGGNVNFFQGNRRFSIIGMSNNVNVQNFSFDDILGMMSGGGGGRGGMGGMMGGGGGSFRGPGGDFMVQQRGGLSTTHALGMNYSDKWGKNIEVSGSYFFNLGNTESISERDREYAGSELLTNYYYETSTADTRNYNHRANFRIEVTIDSMNSFIMRPRFTMQGNNGFSKTLGETLRGTSPMNNTDYEYDTDLTGLNLSNSLVFRHKFKKEGRTFSIDLNTGYAPKEGESDLYSLSQFFGIQTRSDTADQQSFLDANSWNVSSNFAYTEPLSKNAQLMLNYEVSYQQEESDKQTFDYVALTGRYDLLNEQQTNIFSNDYIAHRAGIGYNYSKGRDLNLTLRTTLQNAELTKTPVLPVGVKGSSEFKSILPFAMLRYNISQAKNIRLFYRTSTQQPSVEQLQYVLDNSNPLQLRVGNPNLDQSYQQNLSFHYQATNTAKSTVFFAMLSGSMTNDQIANRIYTPSSDNPILSDFNVEKGAQISQPVNLDGNWNIRSFITYGLPVKLIKSNLNFNFSYNYSKSPGLVNDVLNKADNSSYGLGVTLASNISPQVDFNLSSRTSFNKVINSIQTRSNSEYWNQNTRLRFNWIIFEGFVFRTDLSHQYYKGLSETFGQNYLIWNLGLGKKVLKNDKGELTLTVNDLLKQNRNVSRVVTETYFEDVKTNDLTQYFMLTFTYNLRKFRVGSEPAKETPNWPGGQRPPFMPH
jgi:hypothetical protein